MITLWKIDGIDRKDRNGGKVETERLVRKNLKQSMCGRWCLEHDTRGGVGEKWSDWYNVLDQRQMWGCIWYGVWEKLRGQGCLQSFCSEWLNVGHCHLLERLQKDGHGSRFGREGREGRRNQKLDFGHVKFEILIGGPHGNVSRRCVSGATLWGWNLEKFIWIRPLRKWVDRGQEMSPRTFWRSNLCLQMIIRS